MIDKSKNVCYVINLNYRVDQEYKNNLYTTHTQKFLSQHQILTLRFQEFSKRYLKAKYPNQIVKIGDGDGSIGTQLTISRIEWEAVQEEVLEGITEKEKCY